MGLKEFLNKDNIEFDRVATKDKEKYEEYIRDASRINSEYTEYKDRYNVEIGAINAERLSMRSEIKKLYNFLESIGGSMGERISVFDFEMEAPAIYEEIPFVQKPDKPFLEEKDSWLIWGIENGRKRGRNLDKVDNYEFKVDEKENEYLQDLYRRKSNITFLKDAIKIASLYREIIVIVRDAIIDKIIPEMGLVKAFLYADAIREAVLDGDNPTEVLPNSIEEYKGTTQDIHYQFVKNAFDFYNISTHFFKQPILTDIIEDKNVTDQEKEDFNAQIEKVKESVRLVEEKKVLK